METLDRLIIETVRSLIIVLDADGKIVDFNRACEKATGYSRNEVIGQSIWEKLIPPEQRKEVQSVFMNMKSGDFLTEHENEWIVKDGGRMTIAWSNAVLSANGSVKYIIGTGIDITDRRKSEVALGEMLDRTRKHEKDITRLLEGAHALLELRDFDIAARTIFDACKNSIGATAGYVALLSEDGAENKVLFLDPGGMPCTVDPSLPMPIRGLREKAYRLRQPVHDNDFMHSEWVKYMPEGHADLKNVLFAPMVIGDKALGLLGLANKPGGFTDDDDKMASIFAELAATSLLNSMTMKSLEESESRFRSVAQTATDAIINIDSKGDIVFWNDSASKIFGYTAEKAVGRSLSKMMPERYRDRHLTGMRRAAETGELKNVGRTIELTGLKKDGIEFPIELSLAKWNVKGEIFFTGIIRDITRRLSAEKQVRQLSRAVEQSPVSIVITDIKGDIEYVNPKFEDLTGYSVQEAIGKNPRILKTGKTLPEEYKRLWEAISTGHEWRGEFLNKKKNGDLYWEAASISPIIDADGKITHFVAVKEDITERKEFEESLKLANQKLNMMGSITRHDVLNQVMVLLAWNSMAQEISTEIPVREYLSRMLNVTEAIQRHLEFTSDYQAMGVKRPIWINLKDAFHQAIDSMDLAKITVESDLSGYEIFADPMLEKVFLNLADNSIRHGKRVSRIRTYCRSSGDMLSIVWEDDGIGIKEEHKKMIFDQGFGTHTGLGLFMVKEILGITGITIKETGREEVGAKFEIQIPTGRFRTTR